MSKPKPARLLPALALLLLALAPAAAAQTNVREALARLPDSQAVLYVDAHRIIHDVMPRFMTPADYSKMLNEAQKVGFDARGIDYVAVGARFADPPPANNLPEFVVVLHGNFNADALLALARVAAGAQNITPRSEVYGSKTLEIVDLESLNKKPEPPADGAEGQGRAKPKPMPYPEVAVMALDANTLVAGVPAYVRALVDAAGGRGGLKSSTVDLAARDAQALWSLTLEMPPNTIDYLHRFGIDPGKEADEMVGWVRQVSLAQGMDALNYTLSASLLTDKPEHASAFSGLVRMGLLAAQTGLNSEAAKQTPKHKDYAKTRAALDAIRGFVNRTEGNTLLLKVSVPQRVAHQLARSEMSSKKKAATGTAAPRRRMRRK